MDLQVNRWRSLRFALTVLGVMAAAQGTMNNFTFGTDRYQYYETICGGSGAEANFPGTDAIRFG